MRRSVLVHIPNHLAKSLDDFALATNRSHGQVIIQALQASIVEYESVRVAAARLRHKQDSIISGSELRKRLGRRNRRT